MTEIAVGDGLFTLSSIAVVMLGGCDCAADTEGGS